MVAFWTLGITQIHTHRKAVQIYGYATKPAAVERRDVANVFNIMNCDMCVYFYTI